MRPTSYRGLRKSHKNILEWLKIAFPPPKNRTMYRENTSTPFQGDGEVWGQPQGGGRDPPAPAPRHSPLLLSQARIVCQKHDAVLYQNPFLACTESDQPWVLSQNAFLGGNSTFGRERMKHLKRSACQQKKAVIGIKGRKTFPGSLSSVQCYQKELIHISSFTNWPSSSNRQKHWDPPQKQSTSLCDSRRWASTPPVPRCCNLCKGAKSNITFPKCVLNLEVTLFFLFFFFPKHLLLNGPLHSTISSKIRGKT